MPKKVQFVLKVGAVVLVAFLVWHFGIRPRMFRYQAWEGRVKEIYKIANLNRNPQLDPDKDWKGFDRHVIVVLTSGEEIDLQVPAKFWGRVGPGMRLIKRSGEYLPEPQDLTPEDRQHEYYKAYMEALHAEHGHEDAEEAEPVDAEAQKAFLEKKASEEGVVKLPSGLLYRVLAEGGEGPSPAPDDKVRAAYVGSFIDGRVFDSSEGTEFGVGNVIPGWQEALQLMKPGDKWELFIPAELAYGKQGRGEIGPDKTLVFEIELLEIEGNGG